MKGKEIGVKSFFQIRILNIHVAVCVYLCLQAYILYVRLLAKMRIYVLACTCVCVCEASALPLSTSNLGLKALLPRICAN